MPVFLGLVLLILAEISLYVTLGAWIGLVATLAVVVGSAVAGVLIVRAQGERVVERLMQAAIERRNPLREAGDGMLKALAGVMLFLPGFLTDAVGLILLVPQVRRSIINRVARAARRRAAEMAIDAMLAPHPRTPAAGGRSGGGDGPGSGSGSGDVIDGEAREVPAEEEKTGTTGDSGRGRSGWTRDGR